MPHNWWSNSYRETGNTNRVIIKSNSNRKTGKNTCDRIKEHQSYIRKNYENSLIN